MRTILAVLAVFIFTASAVAAITDAPADEYFGPFKYSAISVRTKIDALARSYNERWADDASLLHDAQMIETSYRVWAQRYPKDKWLAPTAFHLAQLYQNVQTQEARSHALAMYQYVAKTFPNTKESHLARLRLRQGMPPLHPESPVAPTPNPYASAPASPNASGVPAASPSTAPASAAPGSAAPASAIPATAAPTTAAPPTAAPATALPAVLGPKPSAAPKPASSPKP